MAPMGTLPTPVHVPLAHLSPVVHSLPSSHGVPSEALPVGTQLDWPLAQDVVPVRQTSWPGLHIAPEVHAMHCPPLQTPLIPHDVPGAAGVVVAGERMPPSTHPAVPRWPRPGAGTPSAPVVPGAHAP